MLFKTETELLKVFAALEKNNIHPRRYFYPSLNRLSYVPRSFSCPKSENIAARIACLPLYPGLSENTVRRICEIILDNVGGTRA
ncbi:hypothetical protein FACS189460_4010 [Deltaproteobacteria bacterium]|nr:hypothetical protein FACS189460_4010 [Deltaproteobacteria bacterium]